MVIEVVMLLAVVIAGWFIYLHLDALEERVKRLEDKRGS